MNNSTKHCRIQLSQPHSKRFLSPFGMHDWCVCVITGQTVVEEEELHICWISDISHGGFESLVMRVQRSVFCVVRYTNDDNLQKVEKCSETAADLKATAEIPRGSLLYVGMLQKCFVIAVPSAPS